MERAGPGSSAEEMPQIGFIHPQVALRRARRAAARARAEAEEAATIQVVAREPQPVRLKSRHWAILASFAALVVLPFLAVTAYLYARAADQYHSEFAFSVRSEEVASAAAGLLGAITQIGTGTASDTDILFEYIRSQKIVEEIAAEMDLRAMFNAASGDPVFTLGDDPSIEALHSQWGRMVDVSYDGNAGIIHVQAHAFAPQDAQDLAQAILAKSSALVNDLSEQAREDAVRFAREELAEAEQALREMRSRLGTFRRENRIVDPTADAAGQMGLMNALQEDLAQALVERDVLRAFAEDSDQRMLQINRRIDAITGRIESERAALGVAGGTTLQDVIGTYEALLVDLEFASAAYTQAMAGLSAARAEARRQSRYLAAHVQPTLAQSALYPRRLMLAGLTGLFLLLGWSVLVLAYYNVRDSR